jgi:hypothetical protein
LLIVLRHSRQVNTGKQTTTKYKGRPGKNASLHGGGLGMRLLQNYPMNRKYQIVQLLKQPLAHHEPFDHFCKPSALQWRARLVAPVPCHCQRLAGTTAGIE